MRSIRANAADRTTGCIISVAMAVSGIVVFVVAELLAHSGPYTASEQSDWVLETSESDSTSTVTIVHEALPVEPAPYRLASVEPMASVETAVSEVPILRPAVSELIPAKVTDRATKFAVAEVAPDEPAEETAPQRGFTLASVETKPTVLAEKPAPDPMNFGARWSITIPYWNEVRTVVVSREATKLAPVDNVAEAIRRHPEGVMEVVDRYLWEVYERQPVKKDGTGDFSWKDPAAAKKRGITLEEYVIGGMDPDFREMLYHAGQAMDANGIKWSMLSAFRDDYRQSLASGFKAHGGNSLHGGSTATGGYGHGRAIDITTAEGEASVAWHWIDVHGGTYGLSRPMPGADPAHIQPRATWRNVAQHLRENRVRLAGGDPATAAMPEAEVRKTKVAGRSSRNRSN
jgi:hypothetical protein